MTSDADDETIDVSNQLTIENEDESKSNKFSNPVNRRHHLVLLPKNQKGLLEIFSLTSRAYLEGFYRFPRIDVKMMKDVCKGGNVIASSACLAGQNAWHIFQRLQGVAFDELGQHLLDDKAIMESVVGDIGNVYDMMTDVLGEGNYYLELQFNRLPAQNLVNRALLEFARRNNVEKQLIVTCDSHYARPELWKEREVYKKLGFMNYKDYDPNSLPKSVDELKYELYPKNASQVWEEYKKSKEGTSFYDDQVICDAIERTHDIAHKVIGEVPPDRSQKFPSERLVPPDTTSFVHLVRLCKEGLIKRGLHDKQVYIDRLKEELNVIKVMKNADYFVSYQKIMELARGVCLTGPARGCFTPETRVLMADGLHAPISTIKVGDVVKDAYGDEQVVNEVFRYQVDEDILELEFENGKKVRCTKDHKFLTVNRGWIEAQHLCDEDEIVEVN